MKSIPIELQAHLDSQVNTTCLLLKITRNVGAFGAALPPLGVTTLDQAVTYDDGDGAITYSAMAGFIPSNLSTTGDMGVDNAEAEILVPAFDLGPVVEADINAGRYDSAPFVLYRVNYNDLTAGRHEIILSGTLGQARVVGGLSAFCELRSLTQQMKQTVCEVDSITCRATFGSAACGVDVSTLWENGTVSAVGSETDRIFLSDTSLADGDLVPGIVQFLTGKNAGRTYEIEAHSVEIGGGSGGSPGDEYFASVASLLHFDGSDGSTTFTDVTGKTWAATGNAKIDTAQSKFGGSSVEFDGTGDYILATDSGLDLGSGNFTIELWFRTTSLAAINGVFLNGTIGSNNRRIQCDIKTTGEVTFFAANATPTTAWNISTPASTIKINTWYHLAFVRSGSNIYVFVDGVLLASAASVAVEPAAGNKVYIGTARNGGVDRYTTGHIEDFRITKSLARYTSGFTPPAAPYPDVAPTGGADLGSVALTFPTHYPIELGDTFKWRPDCGKQFERDCVTIWDNALNFRGEPFIPVGDEASLATPGANKPAPNSGTPVNDVTVPQAVV